MSTPQTVVILGGGVGGLVAARELRRLLPRRHRVVVVDKQREHLFAPSLLWLLVGQREAHSIQRPLKQLERHGIFGGGLIEIHPAAVSRSTREA